MEKTVLVPLLDKKLGSDTFFDLSDINKKRISIPTEGKKRQTTLAIASFIRINNHVKRYPFSLVNV